MTVQLSSEWFAKRGGCTALLVFVLLVFVVTLRLIFILELLFLLFGFVVIVGLVPFVFHPPAKRKRVIYLVTMTFFHLLDSGFETRR